MDSIAFPMFIFFPLQVVIGTEFLAIILSTGAAAMIAALVQAYRSIKDGAKSDEKDAFADIENSRKKESIKRANAEKWRDYWHSRSGELEYVIGSNLGREKIPPLQPFPELEPEE